MKTFMLFCNLRVWDCLDSLNFYYVLQLCCRICSQLDCTDYAFVHYLLGFIGGNYFDTKLMDFICFVEALCATATSFHIFWSLWSLFSGIFHQFEFCVIVYSFVTLLCLPFFNEKFVSTFLLGTSYLFAELVNMNIVKSRIRLPN